MKTIDVTVSRLIPGPVDEVFDVWLDPQRPGGPWSIAKKAIVQARPDGLFYFGIERSPQLNPHYGRFITVERPRLLVHTWMSEYTSGLETMVEVTFESTATGTQMTIFHRGIPDTEGGRSHEKGWNYFVDLLAKQLGKAA
jgi:uncharacterized protein YndB with AHSA1/START domain